MNQDTLDSLLECKVQPIDPATAGKLRTLIGERATGFQLDWYKLHRAHELELNKATLQYEHERLKFLAYLNGGAASAFLVLVGAASKESAEFGGWTFGAVGVWTLGLCAAWSAWSLAYQGQRDFTRAYKMRRHITETELGQQCEARSPPTQNDARFGLPPPGTAGPSSSCWWPWRKATASAIERELPRQLFDEALKVAGRPKLKGRKALFDALNAAIKRKADERGAGYCNAADEFKQRAENKTKQAWCCALVSVLLFLVGVGMGMAGLACPPASATPRVQRVELVGGLPPITPRTAPKAELRVGTPCATSWTPTKTK